MRFLILALMLVSFQMNAQSRFMRTYGAYGLFNEGKSVSIDTSGNAYICGSTGGSGSRNGDMVVIKTDSLGNELWNKVYGDSATESGKSIRVHPENGFIALGTSNSGINNDYQLFLIRADSNGTILWSRIFGFAGWDEAAAVYIAKDGGFLVASTEWIEGANSTQMTLWKFDVNGDQVWQHQPQATGSSKAFALAEMADSTILIGGSGTYNIGQPDDMQLAKYDKDGNLIWYQSYGTEYADWIAGIAVTNDNRIGFAGNRRLDESSTNPMLYLLDADGIVQNQVIDASNAELSSIAYGPFENTFFFGWNYYQAGVHKAGIFNFTVDFSFKCNSLPPLTIEIPLISSEVIPGLNGKMILVGTSDLTGPGIKSIALYVCDASCANDGLLQVGIAEESAQHGISIYPNPNAGKFSLRINNPAKTSSIFLSDVSGRTYPLEIQAQSNTIEISTHDLSSGIYFLRVIHPDYPIIRAYPILIQQ
jgi:hypothetical protein